MKRPLKGVLFAPLLAVIAISLALAGPEQAGAPRFPDLTVLLAPPPAPGSPALEREIGELLALQAKRTPEQAAFAKADAECSLARFGIIFGPDFTAERLPKAVTFFAKANKIASELSEKAKKHWNQPRPFAVDPAIKPCLDKPSSAAYPSGHTIYGAVTGIWLARMVPEKREAIFARVDQYGLSRMTGGVHYPSDVAAGKTAGTVIAAFEMQDPELAAGYEAARAEVRALLGLN